MLTSSLERCLGNEAGLEHLFTFSRPNPFFLLHGKVLQDITMLYYFFSLVSSLTSFDPISFFYDMLSCIVTFFTYTLFFCGFCIAAFLLVGSFVKDDTTTVTADNRPLVSSTAGLTPAAARVSLLSICH